MAINYFDWWDIFVNDVIGTPVLFLILALVVISIVAAKNRFPNTLYFMVIAVFTLIISIEIQALLPFAILLIFSFIGIQYAKYVQSR